MLHALVRRLRLAVAAGIAIMAIMIMAMTLAAPASAAPQASPAGVWMTIDDETGRARSLVRIWEHDGKLYGRIIKLLENPGAVCERCEGPWKDKPIEGMTIVWDMQPEEGTAGAWEGGRVFDPEKAKSYRATLALIDDDRLEVRGHVGPFSRKQIWERVE
jgi:uncharacterized protein (DUF2147 family)